jgi:imidazole glycerol-phosphate synthase subunit HisH
MERKVVIVDYGLGNLFSIGQAIEHVGGNTTISSLKQDILDATHIVLPGVGAFGDAIENLKNLDLIFPLIERIQAGVPLLGVCLGMQLLFEESEEHGFHKGLGCLDGKVSRFPDSVDGKKLRVPNIGWLGVEHDGRDKLLRGILPGAYMYFVHSYFATPAKEEQVLTSTTYQGFTYCSSVRKNNIYAFQFHPEKSGQEGLKIYDNFINNSIHYGA